jgi:hypothetical protein
MHARLFLLGIAVLCASCGKEPYVVLGAGARACSAYATDKADPKQKDTYLNWIGGYLVARQFSLDRPLPEARVGGAKWQQVTEKWIDAWCAKNPASSVSDAAAALSDELLGR